MTDDVKDAAPAPQPAAPADPAPAPQDATPAVPERSTVVLQKPTDRWPAGQVLSLPAKVAAKIKPDQARPATSDDEAIGWPVPQVETL